MRRSLIAVAAAITVPASTAACSTNTTVTTGESATASGSLPACEGSATSEHGLGEAVQASAAQLSTIRPRFSTGLGTVTDNAGRFTVSLRLCSPGATPDQTRDAATAVAKSIAASSVLSSAVDEIHVENPDSSIRLVTKPFDAARFRSGASLADSRTLWHTDTQER